MAYYSQLKELWTDSVATSSGTRAAPSEATEGMDLSGVVGYRVFVSAASGQTLSGAGTMRAWCYDPDVGWSRNPDLDFTVESASVRHCNGVDVPVEVRAGRVLYQADGITTSGGEVTTRIRAWQD